MYRKLRYEADGGFHKMKKDNISKCYLCGAKKFERIKGKVKVFLRILTILTIQEEPCGSNQEYPLNRSLISVVVPEDY